MEWSSYLFEKNLLSSELQIYPKFFFFMSYEEITKETLNTSVKWLNHFNQLTINMDRITDLGFINQVDGYQPKPSNKTDSKPCTSWYVNKSNGANPWDKCYKQS